MKQIKKLTTLQNLGLDNSLITDKRLAQLNGLTRLKCLNISGTRVTATGMRELLRELPKLKIISERERGTQMPYSPARE
jgi:hypothetical protein